LGAAGLKIYSFGYGGDHNAALLREIAQAGAGMY
jgi:hypothetical protein